VLRFSSGWETGAKDWRSLLEGLSKTNSVVQTGVVPR